MGQWLIWTRSLATRCPVSSWLARHLPSVWRWWSEEDGRTGAKLWMHSASDQEVEEECHVYMCWDFVSCVCFSVWLHVCTHEFEYSCKCKRIYVHKFCLFIVCVMKLSITSALVCVFIYLFICLFMYFFKFMALLAFAVNLCRIVMDSCLLAPPYRMPLCSDLLTSHNRWNVC